LVTALCGGDDAQPEHTSVGLDWYGPSGIDAGEAADHPRNDAVS
jgi:hypothetical protein